MLGYTLFQVCDIASRKVRSVVGSGCPIPRYPSFQIRNIASRRMDGTILTPYSKGASGAVSQRQC
jgi:hypothetical protein